jgi:hypothetical protein
MFVPMRGDVLIRSQSADSGQSAYLVAEAKTDRTLAGPFDTLRDATITAARLARGAAIWQENLDHRGRRIGEPLRLPFRSSTLARVRLVVTRRVRPKPQLTPSRR